MIHEETLLQTIAANCSRLRTAGRFTFDALAKRSGISKGALVEIEQGRTNPSIATLCRLANALSVDLGELLGQTQSKARFVVHDRAVARAFWETKGGSRAALVESVRVGSFAMEIWDWQLAANEFYDGVAHPAGTAEFISVIKGTLTVEAAQETVNTRAGSTLRFEADTPHRYANTRSATCAFQMVVLEPIG